MIKMTFAGSSEVLMIESAMRTISFVSCIKFIQWDGAASDYVHFKPDKKRLGCVSDFLSVLLLSVKTDQHFLTN